jgi:C4-dicarboxylate transporter DctQ subunit
VSGTSNHQTNNEGAQPAPSLFESAITRISTFVAGIAALMVIFMLAIIGYSVIQRYFFGTPVTWTDELIGYLVVAIVMFGAAETLRRGEHITVDLLTADRQGLIKKIIDIWGNLAIIAVAVVLLISTKATLSYSYNFDILSNGYLEVPMWIPQSSLVVGGVLLLLVALVRIWHKISGK